VDPDSCFNLLHQGVFKLSYPFHKSCLVKGSDDETIEIAIEESFGYTHFGTLQGKAKE
jgi:hypothetical protein